MARKQLPTKLHILKGTYRSSRHGNKIEPEPSVTVDLLIPPKWLDKDAKKEWKNEAKMAVKLGILTEADVMMFADICILQARLKHAYGMIPKFDQHVIDQASKNGKDWPFPMIRPGAKGALAHNPYIAIYNRCLVELNKMRSEFGLTPSSRSRIKIEKPADDNPFAALANQ
ncbi:MAG: phage terminase small subunit P27 family [Chlorobiaceae bacterium]|nr:phage terminase small subunit P27 family [Chlorobiaceae bacterium]